MKKLPPDVDARDLGAVTPGRGLGVARALALRLAGVLALAWALAGWLLPSPAWGQVRDASATLDGGDATVMQGRDGGGPDASAGGQVRDADARVDATPDVPRDAPMDAPPDTPTDAPLDATHDALGDGLDDVFRDAHDDAPGVSADVPSAGGSAGPTAPPPAQRRSTGSVARVTLGLFVLLALVILGGSPTVRAFERRAGLTMVIGSGLPFLLLGVIARRPEVDILDDATLRELTPVLEFGLGWIGFRVGADFDVRAMDRWPRGTARVMGAEAACAFLVVVVVMALSLQAGLHPANAIRNAIILGACAAVSAPTGARALAAAGLLPAAPARDLRRVAALDDVVGLLVLGLVTSAFRPVSSGAWALPPLGWLFLQIGMGVVHGALLVSAVRVARNANERFALTLGAVAFSAGMAGYVGFSPLVVGAVAGVVVANLPSAAEAGDLISRARQREFERTIFMVFFVVTGALWNPSSHVGWALVPVYAVARLAGKLLGLRAAREAVTELVSASASPSAPAGVSLRTVWMSLMPTSAVSIAIIVSVHNAYATVLSGALESVVIVGALIAELVFRVALVAAGGRGLASADPGALPMEHEAVDAPATPSAPPAPHGPPPTTAQDPAPDTEREK